MKKLLLVAMLGLFGLAASANNVVQINNTLPGCPGAVVTVQFVQYEIGPCTNNGYSPVYPAAPGSIYNLDDPNTWLPTVLQSYQTFSAIVCITCPGMPPFCLPPVGIGPAPTCDPSSVGPLVTPCCGTIAADVTAGGGGGVCFTLNIHP